MRGFIPRLLCASALLALCACGDRKADFIGARVQDACDESWPICDVTAGCILGPESYRAGRLPGTGKFIVRLAEPSTVKVTFFLEDIGASGEQTVVTFYEDACRARIREELTGKAFVSDAEKFDGVSRQADLNGVGDHLVEFDSDAQARYLVKVDVTPKRTSQ